MFPRQVVVMTPCLFSSLFLVVSFFVLTFADEFLWECGLYLLNLLTNCDLETEIYERKTNNRWGCTYKCRLHYRLLEVVADL